MKINLKQPKYVQPLLLLPFFCLFFYTWKTGFSGKKKEEHQETAGLNGSVGDVSSTVRNKQLSDKLDAYRNTYKDADGQTAVGAIPGEPSADPAYRGSLPLPEDAAPRPAAKLKFDPQDIRLPAGTDIGNGQRDRRLAQALAAMNERPRREQPQPPGQPAAQPNPMEIFKQQMAVMDSISKQNDPAYREDQKKRQAEVNAAKLKAGQVRLSVRKAGVPSGDFNTVMPEKETGFIGAVIDENITGYAGSRLRLRLLEDIRAGSRLIERGTLLYAQISGFSGQRVTLSITSILYKSNILPVRLEVYDMDGLPGLYVPSSAFRDFTKDLGGSAVQGVTIDGSSGNSQFIMSSLDKVFRSTSSAIADMIRKNKAKLKYNSYLYLIDTDALQQAQKAESVSETH